MGINRSSKCVGSWALPKDTYKPEDGQKVC